MLNLRLNKYIKSTPRHTVQCRYSGRSRSSFAEFDRMNRGYRTRKQKRIPINCLVL